VVKAQRERARTLVEMAQNSAFFYKDFDAYDPMDAASHLKPEAEQPLSQLRDQLTELSRWEAATIHEVVTTIAETLGLKLGMIAQPLRVAVAGRAMSPPIDVTLMLVGREKTLKRIERALEHIRKQPVTA
jgi:glutamyl-tRNA synthetase